jgi:hypothetical protein
MKNLVIFNDVLNRNKSILKKSRNLFLLVLFSVFLFSKVAVAQHDIAHHLIGHTDLCAVFVSGDTAKSCDLSTVILLAPLQPKIRISSTTTFLYLPLRVTSLVRAPPLVY